MTAGVGILAEAPIFSPTEIIIALLVMLVMMVLLVSIIVLGGLGVFQLGRGRYATPMGIIGWLAGGSSLVLAAWGLTEGSPFPSFVAGAYALIGLAGHLTRPSDRQPPPPPGSIGDEFRGP